MTDRQDDDRDGDEALGDAERQAAVFTHTRRARRKEIAEDYVELIDDLIEANGEARLVEIARRMGVTHMTASKAVARLQRDGLVTTRPYRSIFLTGKGRQMALRSRRRHQIVLDFLKTIGVEAPPVEKVVIAGAGHVGSWLAKKLVEDDVQVTVIQRQAQKALALATEVPQALVLHGDATDTALLKEAGAAEADYFVAATQDDESNVISSYLAHEAGARIVVSLYQRPEFLNVLRAARVDIGLSPRLIMAGTILRMVHRREILSLDFVASGDAEVVEFQIPDGSRVLKAPLRKLKIPKDSIIGAVIRGEERYVPDGDFCFQVGDRALVFSLTEALPALEKLFRAR